MSITNAAAPLNDFSSLRGQFVQFYLNATFIGRETELARLDEWMDRSETNGPRLAVLTAPAGRGKSALITRWVDHVARQNDRKVIFLPVSSRFYTNRPDIILPAFAAELSRLLEEPIESPSVGAIEAYRDVIARLLGKFDRSGKRCVLVIDGADETMLSGWELGETLLPPRPPAGLRILVTARSLAGDAGSIGWRRRLGWSSVPVLEFELTKLALDEVSSLVGHLVVGIRDPQIDQLTTEIFRLSDDGDPLLVELYSDDIRQALDTSAETLEGMTRRLSQRSSGLGPYFAHWLDEQQRTFETTTAGSVLNFVVVEAALLLLATALGPLRYAEISELLRRVLPNEHIPGKSVLLEQLARFVIGDDSENGRGYVLGHPRFGIFLQENQYDGTPILKRCLQAYLEWGAETISSLRSSELEFDAVPSYLLDFYTQHVVRYDGKSVARLEDILSIEWIEAYRRARKETAFAVAAENVMEALLRLVRDGTPEPTVVCASIRAAILLSSLRQAASSIDSKLLVLAAEHGLLDQQEVLARKAFLPPRERIELLLTLSECDYPGLEPVNLWKEAKSIAIATQGDESSHLLDNVLQDLRRILRDRNPETPLDLWPDAIEVITARLMRPFHWGSARLNIPDQLMRDFPEKKLSELVRIVCLSPVDQALLPSLIANLVESGRLVLKPLAQVPGADLNQILARLFVPLDGELGNTGLPTLINQVLCGSPPDALAATELYLQQSLDTSRRTYGAAVLLGILIGNTGPSSIVQALIDALVTQNDPLFVARLIATGVIRTTRLPSLPLHIENFPKSHVSQVVCEQAWAATAILRSDHDRLWVRSKILQLMSDERVTFSLMKEEAGANQSAFAQLVEVGATRLSQSESEQLLQLIGPAKDEYVRRHVHEPLLANSRENLKQIKHPEPNSSQPTGEDDEDREFNALISYDIKVLEPHNFRRALELARATEKRWERARRLRRIAEIAPKAHQRDVIAEALKEGGLIDDREAGLQALANLASFIGPDETAEQFRVILATLPRLEPFQAAQVAANLSSGIPSSQRKAYARFAIDAARNSAVDNGEKTHLMARVVRVFKEAPAEFVLRCLSSVKALSGERSAWIYNDLMSARWPIGPLSSLVAFIRYASMSFEQQVLITTALRRRFSRFLVQPKIISWVERDMAELRRAVDTILGFAIVSRGKTRIRAIARFAKLVNEAPNGQMFISVHQYNKIRSLYDAANSQERQHLVDSIHRCSNAARRLELEICLFPALSESQRSHDIMRLLSELAATSQTPIVPGIPAQIHFAKMFVLFAHSPAHLRARILPDIIRLGAHIPRRRWLYDLALYPLFWSPAHRRSVSSKLLKTVQDALLLWP
ncbi:ATP-binding protein [Rhizobium ruizarguesonis]|uniref:ATP-binding protein n=1 Tax=Rhizobium ruizarguesonis TaxID=2081791 RepID=UPI001030B372|nr:ATP-binding protein [Rhizobium ruizarguesonis]TBD71601.1 ATP-binding protein [Rhizobium ruizarguesonis]TBD94843.1 ATP-binding protein [Rhizobium ruizarguesonis]TBE14539.1 ATP-binding protein [Rhizobium ruizarguesonis]TBE14707.1 ATP-binding protein [Rhizobium ruizarguesonis]WSH04975.1 ATP-binding protein [Rhizobium ruizarguesonis]